MSMENKENRENKGNKEKEIKNNKVCKSPFKPSNGYSNS